MNELSLYTHGSYTGSNTFVKNPNSINNRETNINNVNFEAERNRRLARERPVVRQKLKIESVFSGKDPWTGSQAFTGKFNKNIEANIKLRQQQEERRRKAKEVVQRSVRNNMNNRNKNKNKNKNKTKKRTNTRINTRINTGTNIVNNIFSTN